MPNRVHFARLIFSVSKLILCAAVAACAGCAADNPTDHPYKITHQYSVSDPQFSRTMANLLGPPLVGGNDVTTLMNGERIFPAMLEAISKAERTVNFETYVYWSGQIGANFAAVLAERARSGVTVNVILDTIGAGKMDPQYAKLMTDAGVHLVKYHPVNWYEFGNAKRLNNRTHRKLLIVDGEIGFIGGVGIADEWLGDATTPRHWRENHYRVQGPVVLQLQAAFVDNWMETTGKVLHGDEYFPHRENTGDQWAQVFKSSLQGGSESMELMYLLSIAAAEKNVRLATPYFIPDKLTTHMLVDARKRGVAIQILVPGKKIDEQIARSASRARWGDLLKAGIEIYEYQPTMYHAKLMIVDDIWVSIGSANLDNRSFRLNDEANLNVLDRGFAVDQINIFDNDLQDAKLITYEEWLKRPLLEQLGEGFFSLFGWLM